MALQVWVKCSTGGREGVNVLNFPAGTTSPIQHWPV